MATNADASAPPPQPPQQDRALVQAYAKLQGENFVYYVRSLSVVLGRRVAGCDDVDVDLGPYKTISRQHARYAPSRPSSRCLT